MSLPPIPFVTDRFVWRGITIEVRYTPSWLECFEAIYGHPLALLEVTSVAPDRAALPITDTGYISHYPAPANVDADGGPVAYVRAWLDHAAQQPAWREREASDRQMSLF